MSRHSLLCHLLVLRFLACPTPLEFPPHGLTIPLMQFASFLRAMAAMYSPSLCLRGLGVLGSGIWSLYASVLTRRPGRIGDITPFERLRVGRASCYVCPHHIPSRHQREPTLPSLCHLDSIPWGKLSHPSKKCYPHPHRQHIPDSAQGGQGCCELMCLKRP